MSLCTLLILYFLANYSVLLFCTLSSLLVLKKSRSDIIEKINLILILYIITLIFVQQVFGLAGLLNSPIRYFLCLALGLAALVLPGPDLPADDGSAPASRDGCIAASLTAGYAFLTTLIGAIKGSLLRPPLDGDSLSYHLPMAAWMLRTGRLLDRETPRWYFPANSELFDHWLLSPLQADLFVGFQNVVPAVILFLSIASLGQAVGGPRVLSIFLALCFTLTAGPVQRQLGTQENDLFLAAFLLASVSMMMRYLLLKNRFYLVVSAMSLGISLGTKYSGIYYLFSYCGMLLLVERFLALAGGGPYWPRVARSLPLALALAFILGGSCYVRNWIVTGSPIYPKGLAILGWTLFPSNPQLDTNAGISSTIIYNIFSISSLKMAISSLLRVGGILAVLSVALLPVYYARFVRSQPQVLLGSAILLAMACPLISPTAAEHLPGTLNHLRHGYTPVRYALPFLGLCCATLPLMCSRLFNRLSNPVIEDLIILATLLASTARYFLALDTAGIASIGTLAGGLLLWLVASRRREGRGSGPMRRARRPILVVAIVGCSALCGILTVKVRPYLLGRRLEARTFYYRGYLEDLGETRLYEWFDCHVRSSRVWISGLRAYPFFGPDLSNSVVEPVRPELASSDVERFVRGELGNELMPDYLIVGVGSGDPHESSYGRFPRMGASLTRSTGAICPRVPRSDGNSLPGGQQSKVRSVAPGHAPA